jgi:glycosyltransferase involved in cell wall biosynthesis
MSAIKPIFSDELKTALVYDRVNTPYGGAEQVLLSLKKLFPDAPLYTSVYQPQKAKWAQSFTVIPSFLSKIPFFKNSHRWLLPLMPLAFESLDLSEYQLIISVTSAEAKGVLTKPNQLHLCYLLTPPRYLYDFRDEYINSAPILKKPGINSAVKKIIKYLTWWDQAAIYRPDLIIPLSKLVKSRVKKIYKLETSNPIYPPSNVIASNTNEQRFKQLNLPKKYLLLVSRLVPYKRVDLAIKACLNLQRNLVIVGEGTEEKRLKKIAGNNQNITFLPSQPQSVVNSLMKHAQLFLAPGIDDFGLSPLHANQMGTPALINKRSGVAEVFDANIQGVVINELSVQVVEQGIGQALSAQYNSAKIKSCASQLTTNKFLTEFAQIIQNEIT